MSYNYPRFQTANGNDNTTLTTSVRNYFQVPFSGSITVIPVCDFTFFDIAALSSNCTINIDTRSTYEGDTVRLFLINLGGSKTVSFGAGCDCPNISVT